MIDFLESFNYNSSMKTDLAYVIGINVSKKRQIILKFEIIGKKESKKDNPILVLSQEQAINLPIPDRIVSEKSFDLRDLIGVIYSIQHENGKVYHLRVMENAILLPDKPIEIKGGKEENES